MRECLNPGRRFALVMLMAACACGLAQGQLPLDEPRPLPGPRPSAATIEQWQARKFGMFIHFGVYSEFGGMLDGKPVDHGYSEQILANAPVPMAEYEAMARQFDPEKFDADGIVALAKSAGMKFIVITAKHHDGFNMFHTSQTKYNIVDYSAYHKDVVKELQEACARAGMKFGVYYSSIDWHYGETPFIESNSNLLTAKQEAFNVAQLKELATGYGPLSEIWFDMGKPTPAQSARFARTVHELQPQTMVSGRVFNYQGDFTVMGDNEVPQFVIDEPWQTPASFFNATWGYRSWQVRRDLPGKIDENILKLVQVVSRGGNYILNIGPEGDGRVVPYEAEVLQGVGKWMAIRGEAIYGSGASPFRQLDFGYATTKPGRLFLFVKQMPESGELFLPGAMGTLESAVVMGDPKAEALTITMGGKGAAISTSTMSAALERVRVKFGESAMTMPVVEVMVKGALKVRPETIGAGADGGVVLDAKSADHFMNYNGEGYEAPNTLYKLRWFVAPKPGMYRVAMQYRAKAAGAAVVEVDGRAMPVRIAAGEQSVVVGTRVLIDGDWSSVEVTPAQPFYKGTVLGLDLVGIRLTPVD